MREYECNAILVPTRNPICVHLACYDTVPMTILIYGHLCFISHNCFSWKCSSKFWELTLPFRWPSGWGVSLWTCSWSRWQKPTCYIQRISVSHVPQFWLASLLLVVQCWNLLTRDSSLVNYFQKINVFVFFPCIIIECARNHKEFRHPVTVSYSENNKCDYDFLALLVVKFCPFHNLSVLQIAEEKNILLG